MENLRKFASNVYHVRVHLNEHAIPFSDRRNFILRPRLFHAVPPIPPCYTANYTPVPGTRTHEKSRRNSRLPIITRIRGNVPTVSFPFAFRRGNPESTEAATELGLLYLKIGDVQRAFQQFGAALAHSPTCTKAILPIAYVIQVRLHAGSSATFKHARHDIGFEVSKDRGDSFCITDLPGERQAKARTYARFVAYSWLVESEASSNAPAAFFGGNKFLRYLVRQMGNCM